MMVENKFRSFVSSEQAGVPNTGALHYIVSVRIILAGGQTAKSTSFNYVSGVYCSSRLSRFQQLSLGLFRYIVRKRRIV